MFVSAGCPASHHLSCSDACRSAGGGRACGTGGAVVADEPKTIDPATLVPAPLAVTATVQFTNASLGDVLEWLRTEQKLTVLLETSALAESEISLVEPVSDRLHEAPLYLLLNRLRILGLAWYFEDNILHITSAAVADARRKTLPYNVGDLLDGGYELNDLADVITGTVAPESWEDVGGDGAVKFLGDVMFIRQTDPVQRQVQGLLAALRKHARQTFILDPPQHLALRHETGTADQCRFPRHTAPNSGDGDWEAIAGG